MVWCHGGPPTSSQTTTTILLPVTSQWGILMLVPWLLQRRMPLMGVWCLELWGNGDSASLSGCHGLRPSPWIGGAVPEMTTYLGLGEEQHAQKFFKKKRALIGIQLYSICLFILCHTNLLLSVTEYLSSQSRRRLKYTEILIEKKILIQTSLTLACQEFVLINFKFQYQKYLTFENIYGTLGDVYFHFCLS